MENREFEVDEEAADSKGQHIVGWLQANRLVWVPAIAVLLVVALATGLIITLNSSEDEEPQEEVTTNLEAPEGTIEEADIILDSDQDGIPDLVEIAGWETVSGEVYQTDPQKVDTDSDGLSDLEEAGEVVSGEGFDAIYAGYTDPTKADSDDDGLDDGTEHHGWITERGNRYTTDPLNTDSDGDGLPDGAEAGVPSENDAGGVGYSGFSNPNARDSDRDGLSDAAEADNGTDPYARDTDGDRLSDRYELEVIGTDPTSKDTDGDGFDDYFEDKNRNTQELDPLFAEVVPPTGKDSAMEFAKGLLAGDAAPGDSVEWLAGNISATAAGMVPGPGWVFATLGDLRDIVANIIKRDWVAVGYSLGSLLPYGGDTVNASRKVVVFVQKNPHLIAGVGALIATHKYLPDSAKKQISKKIWKSWDSLVAEGANDKALMRLQKSGRSNLDLIHAAMELPGHVKGQPVKFMPQWRDGEIHLAQNLSKRNQSVSTQVYMRTQGCVKVCNSVGRSFDVLADGVAHESKVGYVSLTDGIRSQINSDAYFMQQGMIKEAHWHFYPSGITEQVSASKQVIALLNEKGIKYTIHLPKV